MSFSYSYKIIGLLLIGLLFMFGAGLADSVTTSGHLEESQAGTGSAAIPSLNVILVAWDGTQRAHLVELRDQGLLSNLATLSDEGTAMPMEVTGHATDTKAGYAEMLNGQHAVVFDSASGTFYLVTTFMREDPTKPCPVFPPGPEANPGIAVHEYDAAWNYKGYRKIVDGPEDEMGPKGFKFDDSRFYLSYRVVKRFEPQDRAVYAEGKLRVFDREFNLLEDLWLTDTNDSLYMRDHTSVELTLGRVYVAYQYGSAERAGSSDSFVNVYEWR